MARQTVRAYATLSEAAGRIESTMVIPGNMAVILFGVILGLMIGAPIFGFLQGVSRNWLLVSNFLLVIGGLNVPLIFLPRGKLFDEAVKDALTKGQMTPELRAHINDPVVRLAHWYELIGMGVVVFLMVFRPF